MFTARYILYSMFCPHSLFTCFVWIWEQTAIISLYKINWLVFITEARCFYCAVRSTFYVLPTQYIYVFCVDLRTHSDYFTVQPYRLAFVMAIHSALREVVTELENTYCLGEFHTSGHVPWFRRSVAGLSPPSPAFDPRSVCVRFVVHKMHWDMFLSECIGIPLSVPFDYCSILIFILILILSEGRGGEAWDSNKTMHFRMSGDN